MNRFIIIIYCFYFHYYVTQTFYFYYCLRASIQACNIKLFKWSFYLLIILYTSRNTVTKNLLPKLNSKYSYFFVFNMFLTENYRKIELYFFQPGTFYFVHKFQIMFFKTPSLYMQAHCLQAEVTLEQQK